MNVISNAFRLSGLWACVILTYSACDDGSGGKPTADAADDDEEADDASAIDAGATEDAASPSDSGGDASDSASSSDAAGDPYQCEPPSGPSLSRSYLREIRSIS